MMRRFGNWLLDAAIVVVMAPIVWWDSRTLGDPWNVHEEDSE